MTITTIPEIPVLDFTDEELEIGDTTAFVAKMSSFFAKMMQWSIDVHAQSGVVVNLPEEVNAAITAAMSDNATASGQISDMLDRAMPNLVPDHGSFLSTTEAIQDDRRVAFTSLPESIAAEFSGNCMSRYFLSFNGASDLVEVGRYHANDPDLTETNSVAQDFMTAMVGAAEDYPRYAMPWAVAEITAGPDLIGTTDSGLYKFFQTDGVASIGGAVTISFWYRPVDSNASIRGLGDTVSDLNTADPETKSGYEVRVDKVVVGNEYKTLSAGQIYHISVSYRPAPDMALNQSVMTMLGSAGSKHQFALMRISRGLFTAAPYNHTKPIISIQSLDAMNLDGDDVESDNTQIAAIAAQLDENLSQQNALQTQVNALEEEGLAATLTPQQLANLEGAKGIIDWSDITDYSYFQEGDPLLGYCTFEGVTYKLQTDAINNDLGEVVGTTARDALDADYGDYCKIVGGNYWWFDSIADAWIDMGATVGVVPSSAQASPDDGGAWAVVASVSGGVSFHSPDGEYEQGVSIVIDPVDGLAYKASTDAVKAAFTGVAGDTVDLSSVPSAGDKTLGSDWYLADPSHWDVRHEEYYNAEAAAGREVYAQENGVHYQLQQNALNNNLGADITIADRDGIATSYYGDYVTIAGGNAFYFNGASYVDFGTTSVGIVPPRSNLSPSLNTGAWKTIAGKRVKYHDSLALAVADATLEYGDVLALKDRRAEEGGGGLWDTVGVVQQPANGLQFVQSSRPGLVLSARVGKEVDVKQFGAKGNGVDIDTLPIREAVNTAIEMHGIPVHFPSSINAYMVDETITVENILSLNIRGDGTRTTKVAFVNNKGTAGAAVDDLVFWDLPANSSNTNFHNIHFFDHASNKGKSTFMRVQSTLGNDFGYSHYQDGTTSCRVTDFKTAVLQTSEDPLSGATHAYCSEMRFEHTKFKNNRVTFDMQNIQAVDLYLDCTDIENDDTDEEYTFFKDRVGNIVNVESGSFVGKGLILDAEQDTSSSSLWQAGVMSFHRTRFEMRAGRTLPLFKPLATAFGTNGKIEIDNCRFLMFGQSASLVDFGGKTDIRVTRSPVYAGDLTVNLYPTQGITGSYASNSGYQSHGSIKIIDSHGFKYKKQETSPYGAYDERYTCPVTIKNGLTDPMGSTFADALGFLSLNESNHQQLGSGLNNLEQFKMVYNLDRFASSFSDIKLLMPYYGTPTKLIVFKHANIRGINKEIKLHVVKDNAAWVDPTNFALSTDAIEISNTGDTSGRGGYMEFDINLASNYFDSGGHFRAGLGSWLEGRMIIEISEGATMHGFVGVEYI